MQCPPVRILRSFLGCDQGWLICFKMAWRAKPGPFPWCTYSSSSLGIFFVVSSSKLCGMGQASHFLSVQVPSMLVVLLEKIICAQERCQQDWQHEGGWGAVTFLLCAVRKLRWSSDGMKHEKTGFTNFVCFVLLLFCEVARLSTVLWKVRPRADYVGCSLWPQNS